MKNQLHRQQFKYCIFILLTFMVSTVSAQIEINATNFPDGNFRNYLFEQGYGNDGFLTTEEIPEVKILNLNGRGIASLKGIEYFTSLETLLCNDNQLTTLDLSRNTGLIYLYCSNNQLTSLDVSGVFGLKTIHCYTNQLTSLDVSGNTALQYLVCSNNRLSFLDVSQNVTLNNLSCSYNQLSSLDVSQNIALSSLECSDNQLTQLNVSRNILLSSLDCSNNQLSSLDVSQNSELSIFMCSNNQLPSLDISQNPLLTWLFCSNNQLETLDLTHNLTLSFLECCCCMLTSLDVSRNVELSILICSENMIRGVDMDNLISGLPEDVPTGVMDVYNDVRNNEGNICTKEQVAVIKGKGWTPYYYNGTTWIEYEGSDTLTGIELPILKNIDENTPIYDLSGQQVNNLQGKRGVYIIGGKKVLIK